MNVEPTPNAVEPIPNAAAVPIPPQPKQIFKPVDLDLCFESPTNPRKHFDEQALKELSDSIKQQGVRVPLLVRESHQQPGYEIIAGARRYRAAKLAGLQQVPALINEMSDNQVLEVQVIENLQREDVHPLDEALGYRLLMERASYTVADIAAKVGKDESYVYKRLKLTDLTEEAKTLFWAEGITPAMATLIARLQPGDQEKAIKACTERWQPIQTATKLQEWIEHHILLDLHAAPWKKDDATLLSEAGSCVECPKRTGFQPALFNDIAKKDTCTDPTCFDAKRKAFVERKKQKMLEEEPELIQLTHDYNRKDLPHEYKLQQYTAKEAKQEPDLKPALIVDGPNAGKTVYVRPSEIGKTGGYQKSDAEKAEEKKRKAKEKLEAAIGRASVKAVVEMTVTETAVIGIDVELLRFIVLRMWERAWNDLKVLILKRREIEPERTKNSYGSTHLDREKPVAKQVATMNAGELYGLLVELAVGHNSSVDSDALKKAAGLLDVDLAAIAAEVRAAIKPEKAAKGTEAKPAKAGGSKPKKSAKPDKPAKPARSAKPASKTVTAKPIKKATKPAKKRK